MQIRASSLCEVAFIGLLWASAQDGLSPFATLFDDMARRRDVERRGMNAQRQRISDSRYGFGECRDVNIIQGSKMFRMTSSVSSKSLGGAAFSLSIADHALAPWIAPLPFGSGRFHPLLNPSYCHGPKETAFCRSWKTFSNHRSQNKL